MTDLTSLISRLEQASEGSEELDVAITRAIFGYGDEQPLWYTASYTRSIDAALALVPEGMGWGIKREGSLIVAWCDGDIAPAGNIAVRHGATPALALCRTALKAREADRTRGER
jgi:hypothetical protein